jgi:hypothetical protein
VLPIRVKRHVPWSGTGRDPCERYRVRVERARTWIEVPQIDLVGAKVHAKHVIAVEVGEDLVCVRPFLAGGIGSSPVPLPTLWKLSVMSPIVPSPLIGKT